ncbi:hypothetical protein PLEOSDRAFT_1088904 [Pleurotus ostreatus PC15]|uniref:Uncharacterized protein n=1 Tax=Pleurotus ostreatus (strain PC15) TaxID=1137138 RepID=A0A067NL97_PLEO1|nr:hypothetical protein PLEOSDRAFT_1088904 [Pleurotus ostreatus PC15]
MFRALNRDCRNNGLDTSSHPNWIISFLHFILFLTSILFNSISFENHLRYFSFLLFTQMLVIIFDRHLASFDTHCTNYYPCIYCHHSLLITTIRYRHVMGEYNTLHVSFKKAQLSV